MVRKKITITISISFKTALKRLWVSIQNSNEIFFPCILELCQEVDSSDGHRDESQEAVHGREHLMCVPAPSLSCVHLCLSDCVHCTRLQAPLLPVYLLPQLTRLVDPQSLNRDNRLPVTHYQSHVMPVWQPAPSYSIPITCDACPSVWFAGY